MAECIYDSCITAVAISDIIITIVTGWWWWWHSPQHVTGGSLRCVVERCEHRDASSAHVGSP
jgi:hypothetical protein